MTDSEAATAVEVKAELVPIAVPVDALEAMVKKDDSPIYTILKSVDTLDWRQLKPPHMALLLMQKPFPVSGGGQTYLTMKQAIFFATRCYELGVSPFSTEVWFDPAKFTVNLTYEGKKVVARNKGIDLGPPMFERLEREWPGNISKIAGFVKDIGYKCNIRVGKPEYKEFSQYTAWVSEWYQEKSPVWKLKTEHMLQTRAAEKATTLALGTGASSMPDELEL